MGMTQLKMKRMEAHITQKELAKRTGLAPGTLSRLESGDRIINNATFETAIKIADALDIDDLRQLAEPMKRD